MADDLTGAQGGPQSPQGGGKPLTPKGTATAGAIPPEHRANLMLGVAIVGVIGFGLYARSKAAKGGSAGGASANVQPGYGTLSGAAYDSTATDLYNSIEPQLENLQGQLTKLGNQPKKPGDMAGVNTALDAIAANQLTELHNQARLGGSIAGITYKVAPQQPWYNINQTFVDPHTGKAGAPGWEHDLPGITNVRTGGAGSRN